MHVEDHAHSLGGRIIDDIVEPPHLCAVEIASQLMLEALPECGHTNDVHALGGEVVDRGVVRIDVVGAVSAGQALRGEVAAGDVDAGVLHRASVALPICTLQMTRTAARLTMRTIGAAQSGKLAPWRR